MSTLKKICSIDLNGYNIVVYSATLDRQLTGMKFNIFKDNRAVYLGSKTFTNGVHCVEAAYRIVLAMRSKSKNNNGY